METLEAGGNVLEGVFSDKLIEMGRQKYTVLSCYDQLTKVEE